MTDNVSPGLTRYLTTAAVGFGTVGVLVGVATTVGVAGIMVRVTVETGVAVKGTVVGNSVRVGASVVGVGTTTEAGVELIRQKKNTPTITTIRITAPKPIQIICGLRFSSSRCGCARLTRRSRQASLPCGDGAFGVSGELKQSPFC